MKVCVTEKPSVARSIAAILGANDRHDGYFEGNGYQVTWTFGHLCCLKEPNDYKPEWKSWRLELLPMIPDRYDTKLIDQDSYKKQFRVIEKLIASADEVINCGDAGQEGELIQRWVYRQAHCNKPIKRLWISSLTDQSIREGFKQLQDASKYDNLFYAGYSRAVGDWLLGMNATRLFTIKYSSGKGVLSIGRVQTPTLALIVNRQREIDNFVPQDYWELKTVYREVTFASTHGRYNTEEEANAVVDRIASLPLTITDVTTKDGREAPPRLFDLTSLQVECNKKLSMSADQSLKIIQSLYEKKVTTYPRVDTTYLSDDIYPSIEGIMRAMTPYAPLTAPVLAGRIPKSKRNFDNSKVTDHHAIIPTNVDPTRVTLTHDEKLVYNMVARRFIAAFYPDCKFAATTVMATVGDVEFKATGKEILSEGWRALYKKEQQAADEAGKQEGDNGTIKQHLVKGESGPHEPSVLKKTTQPPKLYTEGTLLRAMETAGKTVDDEELREAMKENGIGRPSTRASIIETLFKRAYIRKERKSLVPTLAGIQLIDTIHNELLKSAKLTGIWENKLRRIERGEYSAAQFYAELKEMVTQLVIDVKNDTGYTRIENAAPAPTKPTSGAGAKRAKSSSATASKTRAPRIKSVEEIPCPLCGKGHLLKGRTAYGCSRYNAPDRPCSMRLPFEQYPADLTPSRLRSLIGKKYKPTT